MVTASAGAKRGTRRKFKRDMRQKGTVELLMKAFKPRDKVILRPASSSRQTFPLPRYMGAAGIVLQRRGNAYLVEIRPGGKAKQVLIRPEHLKKV